VADIERSLATAKANHPRTMDSIHDLVQAETEIRRYELELQLALAAGGVTAEQAEQAEALRAMGVELPHRACMGAGCAECHTTGLVQRDVADLDDRTVLALEACAAATRQAVQALPETAGTTA
jgi:hypothetical protein